MFGQLTPGERLGFLRRQLAEGPEQFRENYTYQLFEALVGQPWTAEFENELFALLVRLSGSPEPAERLRVQASRPDAV